MLNPAQQLAVQTITWPLLINAWAGSGKTHTITERVVSMIFDHGIDPRSILCLTFTNKAAKEMRLRIAKKLSIEHIGNEPFRTPWLPIIGTFHSVASFFLRMFIDRLGYRKDFVIYDSDDSLQIMKNAMRELSIDLKDVTPRSIQWAISKAKWWWMSPEVYATTVSSFFESIVLDVYKLYTTKLREANALDFDDLLLLYRKLLHHEEVLTYFHSRFQYYLIDEYQDTNTLQYDIIKILSSNTRNLCVVGDDWQGIYSWRGADIKNILSFQKDYPEALVINLEENYRSTESIIEAANSVIQNNVNQMKKHLFTGNPKGKKILLLEWIDEKHEAEIISKNIYDGWGDNETLRNSDWAILYRTNGQSRLIEESLIRRHIPYRIYGWVKFYERKEIKDILAYFRIIYNPSDLLSLRRIINVPSRKIGDITIDRFLDLLEKSNSSIADILDNKVLLDSLTWAAKISIGFFLTLYRNLRQNITERTVRELMSEIIEKTQYESYLHDEYTEIEYNGKIENLKEFLNMASYYDGMPFPDNIASFLEDIALITDQDRDTWEKDAVSLMTVHLAKWLEFRHVIIAGLEEGIFPHTHALLDPKAIEEERRLMYVAMTRAKERLYMSRAHERYTFGAYSANPQSRFVKEIPETYRECESSGKNFFRRENIFHTSLSHPPQEEKKSGLWNIMKRRIERKDFSLWDRVKHPQYGVGTIVSMTDANADIAFPGIGVKKMNIEIAPIEKGE